MEIRDFEVDFHTFCEICKHKNIAEEKDPCHICLSYPYNDQSTKPVKYEEK